MENYRYTTIRCSKSTKKALEEQRKGRAWDGFLIGLATPNSIQSPDSPSAPVPSDDAPPCPKGCRIWYLGKPYCCQKPPKMVEMDTVKICEVCIEKWKQQTGVDHAPKQAPELEPDPMKPLTWKDKRYCGMEGGIWVKQERCESGECQNRICSWAKAARERRRREQEQKAATT